MSPNAKLPARLRYQTGSFGAMDAMIAEKLHLAEGEEVAVCEEDGRIVIEAVRPKILEPVSDVSGRADRKKKVAEAIDEVMRDHRELFALLAK